MSMMYPGWNGSTPTRPSVPGVYDDSLSILQKVNRLHDFVRGLWDRFADFATKVELAELRAFVVADQTRQDMELKRYTDEKLEALRTELLTIIDGIVVGSVQAWNPRRGKYTSLDDALSDLYANGEFVMRVETHDALGKLASEWDALEWTALQRDGHALEMLYPGGDHPRDWEVANESRIV